MITADDVRVVLGGTAAVDGVSLVVPDTGTLGLVGPNGSGKTTLLRSLYGAVPLAAGQVRVGDRDLRDLSRRQVARSVAVVAQERDAGDTGSAMTVAELVMLGRLPHRRGAGAPGDDDRASVTGALAAVGMLPLARCGISRLSGGEQQRALIARALAQQAPHILLDEPTNHLDIHYQHDILDLVNRLPGSVVVLHDLNLAARYCDRIIVLDAGRMVAEGTPDEVLVPDILEPVYRLPVRRLDVDAEITLVFPRKVTRRAGS